MIDSGRELTTGAISMKELIAIRTLRLQLPIERDLHYSARSISQLRALWLNRRLE